MSSLFVLIELLVYFCSFLLDLAYLSLYQTLLRLLHRSLLEDAFCLFFYLSNHCGKSSPIILYLLFAKLVFLLPLDEQSKGPSEVTDEQKASRLDEHRDTATEST